MDKKELKQDIDMFYRAAMSAVCNCYDHVDGYYPENCGCDEREEITKIFNMLSVEHKRLVEKYRL